MTKIFVGPHVVQRVMDETIDNVKDLGRYTVEQSKINITYCIHDYEDDLQRCCTEFY